MNYPSELYKVKKGATVLRTNCDLSTMKKEV